MAASASTRFEKRALLDWGFLNAEAVRKCGEGSYGHMGVAELKYHCKCGYTHEKIGTFREHMIYEKHFSQVSCTTAKCTFTTERPEDYDLHINNCKLINCGYCETLIVPEEIKIHEAKCTKGETKKYCCICLSEIKYDELKTHVIECVTKTAEEYKMIHVMFGAIRTIKICEYYNKYRIIIFDYKKFWTMDFIINIAKITNTAETIEYAVQMTRFRTIVMDNIYGH